jgi:hypothetical protein
MGAAMQTPGSIPFSDRNHRSGVELLLNTTQVVRGQDAANIRAWEQLPAEMESCVADPVFGCDPCSETRTSCTESRF